MTDWRGLAASITVLAAVLVALFYLFEQEFELKPEALVPAESAAMPLTMPPEPPAHQASQNLSLSHHTETEPEVTSVSRQETEIVIPVETLQDLQQTFAAEIEHVDQEMDLDAASLSYEVYLLDDEDAFSSLQQDTNLNED